MGGFINDLEITYRLSKEYSLLGQKFYKNLKNNKDLTFIDKCLKDLNIKINKESRYAFINRLVALREDSLINILKKEKVQNIEAVLLKAYEIVSDYYTNLHNNFIKEIEDKDLLTPFYRQIFKGVADVGIPLNELYKKWSTHIKYIEKTLKDEFKEDSKIIKFLNEAKLMDKDDKGNILARSYSVLIKEDNTYKVKSYAEAFEEEILNVSIVLENFYQDLKPLEDNLYFAKENYLKYINKLKEAFTEKEPFKAYLKWQELDKIWMNILTPIQIGHPFEYYEDKFRRSVSIEWDLRINNPKQIDNKIQIQMKKTFSKVFNSLKIKNTKNILNKCIKDINQTKLFISKPVLFYASNFNGLFSAQVVPNDEKITKENGKKIFAYSSTVLELLRVKPIMKLSKTILTKDFIKIQRNILLNKEEIWLNIYNITTIGHEYGHILFLDEDTETLMNSSGEFKNIEEFKATLGGLINFFYNEKEKIKFNVLRDTIQRAVSLISWMKVNELTPYYCESLMHLKILFDSGVLSFNKKLSININEKTYKNAKKEYIKIYKNLASFYLEKKDAKKFLFNFIKKEKGLYKPLDKNIKNFVEYYYNLYLQIGEVIEN